MPAVSAVALTMSPSKSPMYFRAFKVLANHINGTYEAPGKDVIRSALYPRAISDIRQSLKDLIPEPEVSVDIETYGDEKGDALRWERGFLGSIALSPDEHSGVAFLVGDYYTGNDYLSIRNILKGFFDNYKGKIILHNGLFDAKFLIRHLYMKDLNDYIGMYEGIEVFSRIDDTMIMAWACINSTERLGKGLKELSKEFTGDYAEDVKDIKLLSKENLLKYNLMDTCGTMYLYKKYSQMIIEEQQKEVYDTILKPSFGFLLEMMMTGLPIDRNRTLEAQQQLQDIQDRSLKVILDSQYVKRTESVLKRLESDKYNASHKTKQKDPDEIELEFNPGSGNQLRILLFDILNFSVIEKTETGQPSVGGAVIKEYLAIAKHNKDDDVAELLGAILDYGSAIKVNGTFIKALLDLSIEHPDGNWVLNGNLKMGGTQSGRLSSSEPNLQNLPAGSKFGKLVKSCIVAPEGWLFAASDYNALEDKIAALLSKDPMKIAEFSKNMDGHSIRALAFFPEELPETDMSDVEAINQIKKDFPEIRQKAKAPSFALQYSGTWRTIQKTLGCSPKKAQEIEINYKKLYSGLEAFTRSNIEHAQKYGFVKCAFGMKLRTPRLQGTYSRELSPEQETEGRSCSNAVSQSYGMLLNRAIIEFRNVIINSRYRHDIRLINSIHDCVYALVRNDVEVIKFFNDELIKAMSWQEDPLLESNEVKLTAEVDFGKSWDKQYTLKNNASLDEIIEFTNEHSLL